MRRGYAEVDTVVAIVQEADAAFQRGSLEAAVALAEQIMEIDPSACDGSMATVLELCGPMVDEILSCHIGAMFPT